MTKTVQLEPIVREVSTFVYNLCKEKIPPTITYHNFGHALDVASEADRIGRKSDLSREDLFCVTIAAWFHDAGFSEVYSDHEVASARIAREFLEARDIDPEEIKSVENYILATRPNYEPETLPEKVIRDADRAHVGKKKYFDVADNLRREWALHLKQTYTDQEWAEIQLGFLNGVRFYTDFAQKTFQKQLLVNVQKLERSMALMLNGKDNLVLEENKLSPSRGVQTMFRSTYRNHINLSSIADSKANIMISVNAILMSILISFISSRIQTDPWLLTPASVLLITSLTAIIFAILSARPKVTSNVFTIEDVRENRSNILFFGNFVNMSLPDFTVGMRELMQDEETLYNNMISDLHGLGQVLAKKYRLLWLSYTIFMAGLSVSVILFLALFLMYTR